MEREVDQLFQEMVQENLEKMVTRSVKACPSFLDDGVCVLHNSCFHLCVDDLHPFLFLQPPFIIIIYVFRQGRLFGKWGLVSSRMSKLMQRKRSSSAPFRNLSTTLGTSVLVTWCVSWLLAKLFPVISGINLETAATISELIVDRTLDELDSCTIKLVLTDWCLGNPLSSPCLPACSLLFRSCFALVDCLGAPARKIQSLSFQEGAEILFPDQGPADQG